MDDIKQRILKDCDHIKETCEGLNIEIASDDINISNTSMQLLLDNYHEDDSSLVILTGDMDTDTVYISREFVQIYEEICSYRFIKNIKLKDNKEIYLKRKCENILRLSTFLCMSSKYYETCNYFIVTVMNGIYPECNVIDIATVFMKYPHQQFFPVLKIWCDKYEWLEEYCVSNTLMYNLANNVNIPYPIHSMKIVNDLMYYLSLIEIDITDVIYSDKLLKDTEFNTNMITDYLNSKAVVKSIIFHKYDMYPRDIRKFILDQMAGKKYFHTFLKYEIMCADNIEDILAIVDEYKTYSTSIEKLYPVYASIDIQERHHYEKLLNGAKTVNKIIISRFTNLNNYEVLANLITGSKEKMPIINVEISDISGGGCIDDMCTWNNIAMNSIPTHTESAFKKYGFNTYDIESNYMLKFRMSNGHNFYLNILDLFVIEPRFIKAMYQDMWTYQADMKRMTFLAFLVRNMNRFTPPSEKSTLISNIFYERVVKSNCGGHIINYMDTGLILEKSNRETYPLREMISDMTYKEYFSDTLYEYMLSLKKGEYVNPEHNFQKKRLIFLALIFGIFDHRIPNILSLSVPHIPMFKNNNIFKFPRNTHIGNYIPTRIEELCIKKKYKIDNKSENEILAAGLHGFCWI